MISHNKRWIRTQIIKCSSRRETGESPRFDDSYGDITMWGQRDSVHRLLQGAIRRQSCLSPCSTGALLSQAPTLTPFEYFLLIHRSRITGSTQRARNMCTRCAAWKIVLRALPAALARTEHAVASEQAIFQELAAVFLC